MSQQVLRNAALNNIKPAAVTSELRKRLRREMRMEIGIPKTATPPEQIPQGNQVPVGPEMFRNLRLSQEVQ